MQRFEINDNIVICADFGMLLIFDPNHRTSDEKWVKSPSLGIENVETYMHPTLGKVFLVTACYSNFFWDGGEEFYPFNGE